MLTVNIIILWGVTSCIIFKVSKDLAACFFRVEQSDVEGRRDIFQMGQNQHESAGELVGRSGTKGGR